MINKWIVPYSSPLFKEKKRIEAIVKMMKSTEGLQASIANLSLSPTFSSYLSPLHCKKKCQPHFLYPANVYLVNDKKSPMDIHFYLTLCLHRSLIHNLFFYFYYGFPGHLISSYISK